MDGWIDRRIDEHGWTDRWTGGWMDRWTDGRVDGQRVVPVVPVGPCPQHTLVSALLLLRVPRWTRSPKWTLHPLSPPPLSLSLSFFFPPFVPLSSLLISGGSVVCFAEWHFTVWAPLAQLLIPFGAMLTIQGFFFFLSLFCCVWPDCCVVDDGNYWTLSSSVAMVPTNVQAN